MDDMSQDDLDDAESSAAMLAEELGHVAHSLNEQAMMIYEEDPVRRRCGLKNLAALEDLRIFDEMQRKYPRSLDRNAYYQGCLQVEKVLDAVCDSVAARAARTAARTPLPARKIFSVINPH